MFSFELRCPTEAGDGVYVSYFTPSAPSCFRDCLHFAAIEKPNGRPGIKSCLQNGLPAYHPLGKRRRRCKTRGVLSRRKVRFLMVLLCLRMFGHFHFNYKLRPFALSTLWFRCPSSAFSLLLLLSRQPKVNVNVL